MSTKTLSTIVLLNKKEAQTLDRRIDLCAKEIDTSVGELAEMVFEMQQREGWKALNFASFKAWQESKSLTPSRAYQLVDLAKIRQVSLASSAFSNLLRKEVFDRPAHAFPQAPAEARQQHRARAGRGSRDRQRAGARRGFTAATAREEAECGEGASPKKDYALKGQVLTAISASFFWRASISSGPQEVAALIISVSL